MNKQSKKLLLKAINTDIATIQVVTTNGVQQLVFDLVGKRQKLYSIVLLLRPDGLVSPTVSRNGASETTVLSQYTALSIEDIVFDKQYILICTSGICLHINLEEAKLVDMSNQNGRDMRDLFVIASNGF